MRLAGHTRHGVGDTSGSPEPGTRIFPQWMKEDIVDSYSKGVAGYLMTVLVKFAQIQFKRRFSMPQHFEVHKPEHITYRKARQS